MRVHPLPATDLPPVYISTRHYGRLDQLARIGLPSGHPVARFLVSELERAIVCRPEDLPPDVVTPGSRVTFRLDGERSSETRILVYPERYEPSGQCVSVVNPVGAALLGIRAGNAMPFVDLDGRPVHIRVERIVFQPETHGPRRD